MMNPEAPRMRLKIDVPPWLKEELEEVAHSNQVDTSTSQLCAFLLAAALREYRRRPYLIACIREQRVRSRSLRFSNDVIIPDAWCPGHIPPA